MAKRRGGGRGSGRRWQWEWAWAQAWGELARPGQTEDETTQDADSARVEEKKNTASKQVERVKERHGSHTQAPHTARPPASGYKLR